jgi:DNA-binding transcriptional MocR family regulator
MYMRKDYINMARKVKNAFQGMKIEDESLSEKAAALMRTKIISGDLAPGVRMREIDIANAFGISRACVREALQTLEGEGLLEQRRLTALRIATVRYSPSAPISLPSSARTSCGVCRAPGMDACAPRPPFTSVCV